ncbi:hypothetical protein NOR_02863 [Metarhizium rileyi]|uniref:Uncharacterized protein n=1 Tax=Metarhizium rileyi (strain RCEF 4871) TaxID=1649241 RepID=A0A162LWR7_METRR|nr:hypothetical protein NOR_02863 [Metarhizium rileyi RCEF 4871]
MDLNVDGLLDEPVEWSTQLQHPTLWTDEYYNTPVKDWKPGRYHQWGQDHGLLCGEGIATQALRHYEDGSINPYLLSRDDPTQQRYHLQAPKSNSNAIETSAAFVSSDTLADECFFANNRNGDRIVGEFLVNTDKPGMPGYQGNPLTAQSAIGSVDNSFGTIAQQAKHGDRIIKINRRPRKKARKLSPTIVEMTAESKDIKDRSKEPPTRIFQAMFDSQCHAEKSLSTALKLHRKPAAACSFPSDDDSFPRTDAEHRQRVRQVFDAICDWSYILEWKAVLPTGKEDSIMAEILRGRSKGHEEGPTTVQSKDFVPTVAELASILPPIEVQQRRVLRQVPNDQTVEWISWGIVGAAIQSQQGNTQVPYCARQQLSKQVVKSLLGTGDAWKIRIANHPRKELKVGSRKKERNPWDPTADETTPPDEKSQLQG